MIDMFKIYSRQYTDNLRKKTHHPVLTENCWGLWIPLTQCIVMWILGQSSNNPEHHNSILWLISVYLPSAFSSLRSISWHFARVDSLLSSDTKQRKMCFPDVLTSTSGPINAGKNNPLKSKCIICTSRPVRILHFNMTQVSALFWFGFSL